jgi:glutathione S-transferase
MRLIIANKNYSSWSLRPWALLRELAIPFDETLVPFEGRSNWNRFREFSPTGQVPCLVDRDVVIWETLAIVEYLAERDPRVWPADPAARAWARCAAAEMHAGFSALRQTCPMNVGVRIRPGALLPAVERDLARMAELWLDGLGRFGGPWLAGAQFSAADAFFAPVAFRIQTYGLLLGAPDAPAQAYASRLLQARSVQQWQREALAETFRDPDHDDVAGGATLIEDLRAPPR